MPSGEVVDDGVAKRSNPAVEPIDVIFAHLDKWRHLPNYQLERRADIFFSVYLKGLLEEFTGVAIEDEMLPEFPIKRDLIWPELRTDKSVKADYALFAKDRSRVFFVELKTDAGSRRDEQDHYLSVVKELGFHKLVEGVRSIVLATDAHQKYYHLTVTLALLGYLELPASLSTFIYPAPRRGLAEQLQGIAVTPMNSLVDVIYIQPSASDGDRCIDFAAFAAYVSRFSDPLSRAFSSYLLLWATAAGAREPASP